MKIFQHDHPVFNLAQWENSSMLKTTGEITESNDLQSRLSALGLQQLNFGSTTTTPVLDSNQFIIFQLNDDPERRILSTSEVDPLLTGEINKDINLRLDFDSFKISDDEKIEPSSKATLQLVIGQEQKMGDLDKLFYCINGGLDLYNKFKNQKTEPSEFKKTTQSALGQKAISLPGGLSTIKLKIVKHESPNWWQSLFQFASTEKVKELISLTGFGGITESAVASLSTMLDSLFAEEPEILFESAPLKVAFSQHAKKELNGGLSSIYVSSLNPGFWVMARLSDYEEILKLKPVYFTGPGILAPEGFSQGEAQRNGQNPFSTKTYAVIRASMKEVDLRQHLL